MVKTMEVQCIMIEIMGQKREDAGSHHNHWSEMFGPKNQGTNEGEKQGTNWSQRSCKKRELDFGPWRVRPEVAKGSFGIQVFFQLSDSINMYLKICPAMKFITL